MHAMQHFTRIAERVDVTPFLEELDAAPQMWSADTSRQRKVRCQRHTRNIFLRTARKPLPPGAKNANDVHESRIARAAGKFPRTLAFCEHTARDLGAELGRATLVALLPKCKVYPHVDAGGLLPGPGPSSSGSEEFAGKPALRRRRNGRDARGRALGIRQQGPALRREPFVRAARAPHLRRPPGSGSWISRPATGRCELLPGVIRCRFMSRALRRVSSNGSLRMPQPLNPVTSSPMA